jgi:UDP-N-acetylglucosamine--N-acetylmuramyl-(pentapeptide) pyrophosphoryl-undecaprenol N-acetylglucosamine transferase
MSYAIAAAGTGGHVYPGLAVGEQLVADGVARSDVLFVGGDRLAADVFPSAGFPYLRLEVRGLSRSLSLANLSLPLVVMRATRRTAAELAEREVGVALGMGSYTSVPLGLAAKRRRIPLFLHEQNAHAGLANRLMGRFAVTTFTSFEHTEDVVRGTHVGNPIRRDLAEFNRADIRHAALERYGLEPGRVTVGVVGGSLGARPVNEAVVRAIEGWTGPPIQIVHLTGRDHLDEVARHAEASELPWVSLAFESDMQYFFAASDVVVARAGGMVAEITATATPAILIPGGFGSGGHQDANARALQSAGAALALGEDEVDRLAGVIEGLAGDPGKRRGMSAAAREIARPAAAATIAAELRQAHG